MHEKASLLIAEDLSGTPKLELMCLQVLSMHVFLGGLMLEISVSDTQEEDPEVCLLNDKCTTKPSAAVAALNESDLPAIVSVIQSCSQSIGKVLQALQQKFPAVSKTQLTNKVQETSDFVDNHWQVVISVGLIILGAFIAGARDLSFDAYGYAVVFLSNIATAIYLTTVVK